MKNIYPFLLALTLVSCSKEQPVRVRGTVNDGTGRIYLDDQGLGEIRKIDSTRLKRNGEFVLKDRIRIPTFYNLHMGDQGIIPLLLAPGETAEIRTDVKGFTRLYEVKGSEESVNLQKLNRRLAMTRSSLDSLKLVSERNKDAGEEVLEGIRNAYEQVLQEQKRFSTKFVLEHMNSLSAIYALYQKYDDDNFIFGSARDIQLYKITAAALDTLYPESEYVKSIKMDAVNLEKRLYAQQWNMIMEKLPDGIPDIRLPDPQGDTMALSSIRNRVVLLSFWASWDPASISLNQDFLKLYDKYHEGGLEIYQVSFDSELESWVAAINYDELPWINVSELSYPESSVARLYNVTEIPSYFLIDRQGQIVGKNYDRIALERKISELVNQN